MTDEERRQEIREGIAKTVCLWHIGKPQMWELGEDNITWEGPPKKDYYEAADMLMEEENSKGCMITVERELPENPYLPRFYDQGRGYQQGQAELLEAGYVCGIPLVEEKRDAHKELKL